MDFSMYKYKINSFTIELMHGKNGFAEILKNLAGYRSENNLVGPK